MVDDDDTIGTPRDDGPTPTESGAAPPSHTALPPAGYRLGELLGRGGMGEVVAGYDERIGRDIAVKRPRATAPDVHACRQFLREARIQARLDHPAIVPVYALEADDTGRPFFTMKRLAGVTLGEILARGAALQRLLRIVVDVCHAVERAHASGVVHRDLKPANIMCGDYGEVYVLDWGVAQVSTERLSLANRGDLEAVAPARAADELVGTPGYMAPEQVRSPAVAGAADVYALGAILFEILTGEPLHPRGTGALGSTLATPQQAPTTRRPDAAIPPELDALCLACLAEEPGDRPTAHVMAARLEAYLDGDRDLERRRALAADLLVRAHGALASSAPDARASAVHFAGRALALDPESVAAAALVTDLIVVPPPTPPPALAAELLASERAASTRRSRAALRACLVPFLLVPIIPALAVLSWPWVVGFYATMLGYAGSAAWSARRGEPWFWAAVPANLLVAVVWSRIAGPFMLTPMLVCASLALYGWHRVFRARPWLLLVWAATAALAPWILETAGILAATTTIEHGAIVTRSAMYALRGDLEVAALVAANGVFVLGAVWLVARAASAAVEAQRRVAVQNWHLRQLVVRLS